MEDKLDALIEKMGQQAGQRQDSDFFRAFEYFVSQQGIRGKTTITPAQRNMIWVFDVWDKRHPTWGLADAATSLAQLFISEGGESRRGLVELFQGLLRSSQPQLPQEPLPPNDPRNRPR